MKFIKKNPPPQILKQWFDEAIELGVNFRYGESGFPKADIKHSLLAEQGFLCCYTGKKVNSESSHIEHIKPQELSRIENDHDDVEYKNMLAAFPANKNDGTPNCPYGAVFRDSWYDEQLFVTPLRVDCEQRFAFDLQGNINPANQNDEAAEVTIERLNLRHKFLVDDRKTAIDEFLFSAELSKAQVERLRDRIMERNGAGHFRAFCFVLKQACEIYLKKLEQKHTKKVAIQSQKNKK